MLRTVWYKIEENKTERSEQVFRELQEKGIPCRKIRWDEKTAADERAGSRQSRKEKRRSRSERKEKGKLWTQDLVLTDDRTLVRYAAQNQIACVGVAGIDTGFFEGTDLVVEEPEELELRELEDYLCRHHGIPVTIAQTERLILREMVREDWQILDWISRQKGMEKARRDPDEGGDFEEERLAAYIGSQYRLYGYGLWSVVLADGDSTEKRMENSGRKAAFLLKQNRSRPKYPETVIGCCGFSELDRQQFQRQKDRAASRGGNEASDAYANDEKEMERMHMYGKSEWEKESSCGEDEIENPYPCGGNRGKVPYTYNESKMEQADPEKKGGQEDWDCRPVLELQYMLNEAYRRQGYGTEMCRAAVSYAYEYLEAREIWVRVRSDYPEALSFAQSVGFCLMEPMQDAGKLQADESVQDFGELRKEETPRNTEMEENPAAVQNSEAAQDLQAAETSAIVQKSEERQVLWLRHIRH